VPGGLTPPQKTTHQLPSSRRSTSGSCVHARTHHHARRGRGAPSAAAACPAPRRCSQPCAAGTHVGLRTPPAVPGHSRLSKGPFLPEANLRGEGGGGKLEPCECLGARVQQRLAPPVVAPATSAPMTAVLLLHCSHSASDSLNVRPPRPGSPQLRHKSELTMVRDLGAQQGAVQRSPQMRCCSPTTPGGPHYGLTKASGAGRTLIRLHVGCTLRWRSRGGVGDGGDGGWCGLGV
jgi:hypothetical protein